MATADMETWETQTGSTTFVYKRDKRSGDWRATRVGGIGPKRIRLSKDEREYNQEMIPEENAHLDPFKSGRLVRIDGDPSDVVTDAELKTMLALTEEDFELVINDIDEELTVRRLLELSATEGRMWQVEMLRNLVDDRYGVSKSQKTVLEMMQTPDGSMDEIVTS